MKFLTRAVSRFLIWMQSRHLLPTTSPVPMLIYTWKRNPLDWSQELTLNSHSWTVHLHSTTACNRIMENRSMLHVASFVSVTCAWYGWEMRAHLFNEGLSLTQIFLIVSFLQPKKSTIHSLLCFFDTSALVGRHVCINMKWQKLMETNVQSLWAI